MDPQRRRQLGAFYTPSELVDALLDAALEPALAACTAPDDLLALRVLDPACGNGAFLVPALQRMASRAQLLGLPDARTRLVGAGCIRGIDLDPAAVAACRAALGSDESVSHGDGLLSDLEDEVDVVVGNPPFLSQLDRRTAVDGERRAALRERYPLEAYTDAAALFLLAGLRALRAGGRLAMVQPLSVLASRDAGGVRDAIDERAVLTYLWVAGGRIFPDADVHVCAVGLRRAAVVQPQVQLAVGGGFREVGESARAGRSWAALGAQAMGVPAVEVRGAKTLGDIATCSADFRDTFYALAAATSEGTGEEIRQRVATTAMIEPASIEWGTVDVRFAGGHFLHPVVAGTQLQIDPWIRQRAVPKILVATQTRVVEAAMDAGGTYLPVTPIVSVVPNDARDLSLLAALLLSPVASASVATEGFGTARSPLALKVTVGQLRALPLPLIRRPWDEAAALIEQAHDALSADERLRLVERAGRSMLEAHDLPFDHPCFAWWAERLRGRMRTVRP